MSEQNTTSESSIHSGGTAARSFIEALQSCVAELQQQRQASETQRGEMQSEYARNVAEVQVEAQRRREDANRRYAAQVAQLGQLGGEPDAASRLGELQRGYQQELAQDAQQTQQTLEDAQRLVIERSQAHSDELAAAQQASFRAYLGTVQAQFSELDTEQLDAMSLAQIGQSLIEAARYLAALQHQTQANT